MSLNWGFGTAEHRAVHEWELSCDTRGRWEVLVICSVFILVFMLTIPVGFDSRRLRR